MRCTFSGNSSCINFFWARRKAGEKSQHDWLAVDAAKRECCTVFFVESGRFVHVRHVDEVDSNHKNDFKNPFEFLFGKEIHQLSRVAGNSVEVSFCVPGSAACGSTCRKRTKRRNGLVTSLCWLVSIHFYLQL